jgi:hypothetical protein
MAGEYVFMLNSGPEPDTALYDGTNNGVGLTEHTAQVRAGCKRRVAEDTSLCFAAPATGYITTTGTAGTAASNAHEISTWEKCAWRVVRAGSADSVYVFVRPSGRCHSRVSADHAL